MSETITAPPEAPESPTEFLDAVAETAAAQPDLVPDASTPDPEPAPKPDKIERRIANLTRKMADETRAREAAERERDAALALHGAAKGEDDTTPRPRDAAADIEARAAAMVAERAFNERIVSIDAAGKKDFGVDQWEQVKTTMTGLGAPNNPAFLQALAETDNAAKIYAELADDTDALMDLLSLPPARMATRLGRMDAKLSAPAATKPLSDAPPPAPRVKPSGVVAPSDPHNYPTSMSMREWNKMMDAHLPVHLGGKKKAG